jgi:hypothetical protein
VIFGAFLIPCRFGEQENVIMRQEGVLLEDIGILVFDLSRSVT